MGQASITAYLAMILLVPAAVLAFALLRAHLAVAFIFLTSALLLPEQVAFDAPGLPPTDKYSLAAVCSLVGVLFTARSKLRAARPGRGIDLFILVALVGYVGTSLTNKDVLTYGTTVLPGLTMYDAFSGMFRALVSLFVPFFIGRALYRDADSLQDLMKAMAIAAVLYSPLIVLEARISPQLHRWVYGFHQHEFIQTVRLGGYRPMVFMTHGLTLSMFILSSMLATASLYRGRVRLPLGLPPGPVLAWLVLMLLLMRSTAVLVYGAVALILLFTTGPKAQARAAKILTIVVMTYPVLRSSGWFPIEKLLEIAANFNQERAESLAFRFYNEAQLLEKALERWMFGWGSYGRNRIYSAWGQDISVTDGFWVIVFGSNGLVGFIGTFGVLLAPVWMAAKQLRRLHPGGLRNMLGALTLTIALLCVDLLPNTIMSGITMLLAGALAGIAQGLKNSSAPEHVART